MEEYHPLPISGSPEPSLLFVHPNNDIGEYLSDIQVSRDFAISVTSKGQIYIHKIPTFEALNDKRLPNVSSCMIQDQDHIIVLHTTLPFIYNLKFSITTSYLKRLKQQSRDSLFLTTGSYSDNLIIGTTNSSTLILWDVRTSDAPQVLTLPRQTNVQSVSILNKQIVIGQGNGKISVLDARNMKQRLCQIDLASQIVGVKGRHDLGIVQNPYDPWIVGFQYSGGPAGIVDLMTKKVTHQICQPQFVASNDTRYTRPKPTFYKNAFCIGYSWSRKIQIIDYLSNKDFSLCDNSDDNESNEKFHGKIIDLPSFPISINACDDLDGIFAASASGEIFQVF